MTPERLLRRHALVLEEGPRGPRVAAVVDEGELPPMIPCRHFPGEAWAPAAVMAHVHLESWDATAADWPRAPFPDWVEALLAWRQGERMSAATAAAHSLDALARGGTALVASHVGEAGATRAAAEAVWQAGEVPGLLAPQAWPEVLAWQEWIGPAPEEARPPAEGCDGFAVHAPYSVPLSRARELFAGASPAQPVSVHLGEHAEERELLARGSGPMAAFLARREAPLPTERFASPVDWLAAADGLKPGVLAVHGGDLEADELARLAAAGVAVVFCPGTHAWFGRPRPAFLDGGLPLPALGCDSRASNETLDPLHELAVACRLMPEAGAAAWWEAATLRGAEALARPDLGHLGEGATARVLRLVDAPEEALASADAMCAWMASGEARRVEEGPTPPC
ncbi:MAG: amidohydrolase family protein [Planctomycetota bacterium]|jgi:cytosine/adenosine deaminase-related metal-dependent hydrolase